MAGGGVELDGFNSISVFHIAWTLFVHVTQCTSGTHNKSLSTTLGKIKTDKLKIHKFIYVSPLISVCFYIFGSHLGFMEYLNIAITHYGLETPSQLPHKQQEAKC